MVARERDLWLGDFSLVLSKDHFRSVRRDPQYEVFSESKPLAFLWLVLVAAAGGALGGTLVSGALSAIHVGTCHQGPHSAPLTNVPPSAPPAAATTPAKERPAASTR